MFFIFVKAKLTARSKNSLICLEYLISIFSLVLEKLDDDRFPFSIRQNFETDENSGEINEGGFSRNKMKCILQSICDFLNYCYKEKSISILSNIDRIKHEISKIKEISDFGPNFLSLKDIEVIKSNSKLFRDLYCNYVRFEYFDESLLNFNLRGDLSPVKRHPYKNERISQGETSSENNIGQNESKKSAYRRLDFSNIKNISMGFDNNNNNPRLTYLSCESNKSQNEQQHSGIKVSNFNNPKNYVSYFPII